MNLSPALCRLVDENNRSAADLRGAANDNEDPVTKSFRLQHCWTQEEFDAEADKWMRKLALEELTDIVTTGRVTVERATLDSLLDDAAVDIEDRHQAHQLRGDFLYELDILEFLSVLDGHGSPATERSQEKCLAILKEMAEAST